MIKYLVMGLRGFFLLAAKIWSFICYCCKRQARAVIQHQTVKYEVIPLSPLSKHRLSMLKKKILVLDLDETLIHSHHDGVLRQTVKPGTPPDFVLKVNIDRHPVRFFVHKRPHVDYFLEVISQWYELVVFTASMEIYGAAVADKLDNNRNILKRRYYRQTCLLSRFVRTFYDFTPLKYNLRFVYKKKKIRLQDQRASSMIMETNFSAPDMHVSDNESSSVHCHLYFGSYTKDLSEISKDLSNIFILDNSPVAYQNYEDNAIPIKSWFSDPTDTSLLCLLPMLDSLRFCNDVRSVLCRNIHRNFRF